MNKNVTTEDLKAYIDNCIRIEDNKIRHLADKLPYEDTHCKITEIYKNIEKYEYAISCYERLYERLDSINQQSEA